VVVSDRMQRGYTYVLAEPAGRNFDPDFRPELTPAAMPVLGVFGGKYMSDCRKEFPRSWFARAKLCAERHDPTLNLSAATPWVAAGRTTHGRSSAGARCGATSPRSRSTAVVVTCAAAVASGKRCPTGPYDARAI
jgi:hypothetical protein